MVWFWKGNVSPKTAYRNHSFSVLGNTIVSRIHFAEMSAITSFDQGFQQVEHTITIVCREKPLNILKYKGSRPVT
jgi:hypothetical protein